MPQPRNRLGVITSGSLIEGLTARLEARESVEDMRVGKFVVIQGEKHEFFSMVTDVALEATNQKILTDPPDGDPFIHAVLAGTSTYNSKDTTIDATNILSIGPNASLFTLIGPLPVEIEVQYSLPIMGTLTNAISTISLQVKIFGKVY